MVTRRRVDASDIAVNSLSSGPPACLGPGPLGLGEKSRAATQVGAGLCQVQEPTCCGGAGGPSPAGTQLCRRPPPGGDSRRIQGPGAARTHLYFKSRLRQVWAEPVGGFGRRTRSARGAVRPQHESTCLRDARRRFRAGPRRGRGVPRQLRLSVPPEGAPARARCAASPAAIRRRPPGGDAP